MERRAKKSSNDRRGRADGRDKAGGRSGVGVIDAGAEVAAHPPSSNVVAAMIDAMAVWRVHVALPLRKVVLFSLCTFVLLSRHMKRRKSTVAALLLLTLTLLAHPVFADPISTVVQRVIDGDTVMLKGGARVRLRGVDTPESVHPRREVQYFAKESSAFLKKLIEGKKVLVQFDSYEQDPYGRDLAYLFLVDGTFVNAEIVRRGYGFTYTKKPFKYLKQFQEYQRQARSKGLGLWANPSEAIEELYNGAH